MQRNYSIDTLKALCAFLVIILHVAWAYTDTFLPLARAAVPVFFMISGYFMYRDSAAGVGADRLRRALRRIGMITLWATLLFIGWSELMSLVQNHRLFTPSIAETLIDWALFNDCPFGYHLWYLYAYIYVLLIIGLIDRAGKWRLLFRITPFLLLALPLYSLFTGGDTVYLRNFLFEGLPYFALGAYFKSLKAVPRLRGAHWWVLLFCLTSIGESIILTRMGLPCRREMYISTPLLAISLFLMFLSIPTHRPTWLSKLGERDSLYIYILHPIFIQLLYPIAERTGLTPVTSQISPFIVFFATLLAVCILRRLRILRVAQ